MAQAQERLIPAEGSPDWYQEQIAAYGTLQPLFNSIINISDAANVYVSGSDVTRQALQLVIPTVKDRLKAQLDKKLKDAGLNNDLLYAYYTVPDQFTDPAHIVALNDAKLINTQIQSVEALGAILDACTGSDFST
jgi:hypothetical protein